MSWFEQYQKDIEQYGWAEPKLFFTTLWQRFSSEISWSFCDEYITRYRRDLEYQEWER